MSVVIKGVDIPENCVKCKLTFYDDDFGKTCIFTGVPCLNLGIQNDCPISALPQKHGRLIDADSVYANIDNLLSGDGAKWLAERAVHDAPTIIEAEDNT